MLSPLAVIALVFFLVAMNSWGEELDSSSQEALQKTQQLLRNRDQRDAAVKKDSKATAANQNVKRLTGGDENTSDDIYALAAEVFETVVRDAHGDPQKMQEAMERFKKDPEAFASQFTPEQRAKLHEIAEKLGSAPLKQ